MGLDEKMDENKDARTEEQRMTEKITEDANKIEIPESLQPDAVEKMLEQNKIGKQRRKKRQLRILYTAAAACICFVAGITAVQSGWLIEAPGKESKTDRGNLQAESSEKSVPNKIASANGYDDIYDYLKAEVKAQEAQAKQYAKDLAKNMDESAAAESAADAGPQSYGTGETESVSNGYADTNVRETGVGEGDVVKTDGKNLYIQNGQNIQIVSIAGKEMEQLASIQLEEEKQIYELYIEGDSLLVAYTETVYEEAAEEASASDTGEVSKDVAYLGEVYNYTGIAVYNVAEPSRPELVDTFTQSGVFYTMRVKGGYVYLLSHFYADLPEDRNAIESYIPEVQGKSLESSRIFLPQYQRGSQYTVISSFAVAEPSKKTDSAAVFGNAGLYYVSGENIYICEDDYSGEETEVAQTCIRKIGYKDGVLEAKGQTKIDGILHDSFSIDEYKGNLRLVTTVSQTGDQAVPLLKSGVAEEPGTEIKDSNSLYVLNADLEITGEIHDLAEGEQIYSARFIGDTGYFVTYRQTDPLFSADLSDPAEPKIIGALKIPGFSEYLHPFGEGKLLGIGMDVDETGTVTNGVKVSMFDISDPSDVEEVQKYILEDTYSTDITYDYRAALISEEKNLIGFTAYGQTQIYYVLSYDNENGFTVRFSREMMSYAEIRGLYVGETFYLVAGNIVEAYTMDTFDKIDDIVL